MADEKIPVLNERQKQLILKFCEEGLTEEGLTSPECIELARRLAEVLALDEKEKEDLPTN